MPSVSNFKSAFVSIISQISPNSGVLFDAEIFTKHTSTPFLLSTLWCDNIKILANNILSLDATFPAVQDMVKETDRCRQTSKEKVHRYINIESLGIAHPE